MSILRRKTAVILLLMLSTFLSCNVYCNAAAFLPPSVGNSGLNSFRLTEYREGTQLWMGLRGKKVRKQKKKAQQLDTPPLFQTPYGPIRVARPPTVCESCQGRGVVRCNVCEGRGVRRSTGNRKSNPIDVNRLVGSKWTSVEPKPVEDGGFRRQFHVKEIKGSKKKENLEVRMNNCCGGVTYNLWIPMEELRSKQLWRMGWVTLEDIRMADGGPLRDAKVCFRCKGAKVVKCDECDGRGEIPNYEPLHD